MNILHEVAGGLLKMFVGDSWLTLGVLGVVSPTGFADRIRPRTAAVVGCHPVSRLYRRAGGERRGLNRHR
jgi:hypothetical protein